MSDRNRDAAELLKLFADLRDDGGRKEDVYADELRTMAGRVLDGRDPQGPVTYRGRFAPSTEQPMSDWGTIVAGVVGRLTRPESPTASPDVPATGPVTVSFSSFTRTDDGDLVTEASDLRIPPGRWPAMVVVTGMPGAPFGGAQFHRGRVRKDRDGEISSVEYTRTEQDSGGAHTTTLVVLND